MTLEEYNKKRDFNQTKEPEGDSSNIVDKLPIFIVQKHQASSLHYDLRLEANGVLKSWAIPKGPMTNPGLKHLAVMVEDHPLEYSNFEGVIPSGNYGAGSVIIWDQGQYYVPGSSNKKQIEDKVNEGLARGHLAFILKGEKLSGEYALVRLKRAKEKNAWLLIKANDEFAKDIDITKEEKSVVSGKTNKEMESIDRGALGGIRESSRLEFVKPMLASLVNKAFDRDGWIFEIKWDGYRVIADVNKQQTKLFSRNQKILNSKFRLVYEELKSSSMDCIIDGEMVVFNDHGLPAFNLLQNYPEEGGKLIYYVFDLLYFENKNLESLPLIMRKSLLASILPASQIIKFSDHIETFGTNLFKVARERNLEGIMAKMKESKYVEGVRSKQWLKIKNHHQIEAIIGGYTKPRTGRTKLGSLLLGLYDDDDILHYIGGVGTGFTEREIDNLLLTFAPIVDATTSFYKKPKVREDVVWLKPRLVCEIKFQEWTSDGMLRQAVYLGLRHDIDPQQVKRESAISFKGVDV